MYGCIAVALQVQYNSSTPLKPFLSFYLPLKEKEKHWRMTGLTMVQCIYLNQNNICVTASLFCTVRKNWPYLPTTTGSYSRQAGQQIKYMCISNFWNSLQVKLFELVFCLISLQCYYSVRITFQLDFKPGTCLISYSSKAYFKVAMFWSAKNSLAIFSCQSLLLGTSIPN